MSGHHDLTADVDIDMSGLLGHVWQKKLVVLAIMLVCGTAVMFLLSGVDPRFRSEARLIIENRESPFTRKQMSEAGGASIQFDEQAIGSQIQILTSDDLMLKVISELKLASHREFSGETGPSLFAMLFEMTGMSSEKPGITPEERVLEPFRKKLSVYSPAKSRVIAIEFSSTDPALAQAVPNALAKAYLEFIRGAEQQSTEEATGWLGPEIEDLRKKLREAEANVAEFRSNSDILIGNNNALLATQQLSEASSELSRVRSEKFAADGKVRAIREAIDSGDSLDVIPEVMTSSLVQRLREREVSLQAQISELSTTLLPNHPRLKALQSQVGNFQKQIRSAAGNILKSLENNVGLYAEQEAALQSQVDRLKAEAGRVGEAEVELRALEREATAQRELLETYLSQYREAASRQNREYFPVDARIISRAIMPAKPYFPKILPFAAAAMVGSGVLSVIFILSWALMTGKAFKPTATGLPVQGAPRTSVIGEPAAAVSFEKRKTGLDSIKSPPLYVPPDKREQRKLDVEPPPMFNSSFDGDSPVDRDPSGETAMRISEGKTGSFAFSYACQAIGAMPSARVAVLSPGGDLGSMMSWLLARTIAESGKSVIIADLTGSSVTSIEFLGTAALPGIKNMLAGQIGFAATVHKDRLSSAHILPSGNDDAEFTAQALAQLDPIAETLSDSYDFVIFDCGMVGASGIRNIADEKTVVLVSAEGASQKAVAELESEALAAGYSEAISVRLEQADREKIFEYAA